MANISLVTANKVSVVESIQQRTKVAAEAITAGAPVREDTDGKWTNANGTSTTENRVQGIATKTVVAGEPLTALRRGLMDGFDLSGLAYDAPVYVSDTDGRLGEAGDSTNDVAVGRVTSATATTIGTAYDKILSVEL